MHATLASVITLFLVVSTASPGLTARVPEDGNRSRPSVVIVSAHLGYHRDAIGAGVIVARAPYGLRIVTARHVAQTGDLTVWIDGAGYAADVVRTFAHRDLALVDAVVPASACAHVRAAELTARVAADDAIVVWGEDDAGPRMERGRVVATQFIAPDDALTPPLLDIDCPRCARGDSGAGIFDADGRLIGILVARYRASDLRILATVAEFVDPSLFTLSESEIQATAGSATTTVRSQNDPKLSPG